MIIGIIGFGRFGKLWAQALSAFGTVKIYDEYLSSHDPKAPHLASLEEVVQSDFLFLLVPISEFERCCRSILPFLKPHTLVADGCSVKMYPAHLMKTLFPENQPIIATHPLFGPDSVKRSGSLEGHKIVICPIRAQFQQQLQLESLFKQLGLKVLITTPQEHDQQMAHSQGLVHLIGRGLAALDLHPQPLATPDFQALLNINQMAVHDTWQLFLDMQRYNPFTPAIRKKFIHKLHQLEDEIHVITIDQPAPIVEQAQPSLEQLREKINRIDSSIIEKIAERQKISKQVGELKAKTGMPVLDSKREEQLMNYYEILSKQSQLDPEFVKTLFKMMIAQSKAIQKKDLPDSK